MKGIDVSDNQGYIDWAKVKADGVQFAILRSTRGSGNPDKQLASNIKGCVEADIPFDFYKYMYALSEEEARQEAWKVAEALVSMGIVPDKSTFIWGDVEDKTLKALSTQQLTGIVKAFKETIISAGFSFGLYMGKYDYESGEVDASQFNDDLWIARYYNGYNVMDIAQNPNQDYAPVAKAGSLWGWQYSSSGRVNGINGDVDLDIAYYDIKKTEVLTEYYQTPEFTLIDSLNKIGVDSSYKNRLMIAVKNGIYGYSGKAEENLRMLELLNSGKLIK